MPPRTVSSPDISMLLLLAAAGAVGTLARYGLSALVNRVCGPEFPWGTLVVNVLGCLMFGIVWSLSAEREAISSQARLVMLTGFMGAFTTFSTFAFETSQMLSESRWPAALGNFALQNAIGIVAVFVGLSLGRWK